MRRLIAIAAAASLLPTAALSADLIASLNAEWDSPPAMVESGTELVARVDWDANYAHGFIDGTTESGSAFDLTVRGGLFLALPDQCSAESEWTPTTIRCVIDTPDDDGIAGYIAVPVRAWGGTGDSVTVIAADQHGNTASTPALEMMSDQGVDIALSPTGITGGGYRFNSDLLVDTTIPVMVSIPFGAEPLTGLVTVDLDVETTVGPSVADSIDDLRIVPVPGDRGVTGIAQNGPDFPVPDVSWERLDRSTIRLTVPVPDRPVGPSADPAGNILDTVPVASFGVAFRYPAYSASLRNSAVSWSATVRGWTAATESGPVTEQLRTTNDRAQTSVVDTGSVSGKFVNGHAPDPGGVLAEPGDDPSALPRVHRDVWDPELGTGALSAGANHWIGRGPILPGDQMVGIVNASHYVGMSPSQFTPGTTHGYCLIFDRERGSTSFNGRISVTELSSYRVEYLSGGIPGGFMSPDCGQGAWSTKRPADVGAIRVLFDPSKQDARFATRPILGAGYLASESLGEGERAWMASGHSTNIAAGWDMTGSTISRLPVQEAAPTYTSTTTFRDAVEAVPYRTTVQLGTSVDTVKPGDPVDWTVQTRLSAAPFADRGTHSVHHRLVLPPGTEVADTSMTATVSTEGGRQVVSWASRMAVGSVADEVISTIHRTGTGTLTAQVTVENMTGAELGTDSDTDTIIALASAGTHLSKATEAAEFALDGSNRWTVTLENRDLWPVAVADTIDILPYTGDGRETLTSADLTVTEVTGEEIWVSTADPATISRDPLAASNGVVGRPSALWERWDGQEGISAIRWITRDLGPGMSVDYTIDYTASGATNGDRLVNSAQSRTSGALTTMVDSMQATTIGPPADLQVDKRLIGDDAVLAPGEELLFEITVHSAGPGTVRGAVVTDIPLEGLEDVRFVEASRGTFEGDTWRIGDLPEGRVETATVRATALGGPVENVIVGCDADCVPVMPPTCEPNVDVYSDTDRCDRVRVDEQPVLQIDKSLVGELGDDEATYSITVRNGAAPSEGAVTAGTLIQAVDLPGSGIDSIVYTDLSQGTMEGNVWSIGTLAAGQEATATVSARLTPEATSVVNAISVSNPTRPRELGHPHEAIPNDDVDSDTDQADVVDTARDGALAINKELIDLGPDGVRFVIEVGNLGGETVENVRVVDLPGDDLDSARLVEPSAGTSDGLTWSVGDLAPGQVETVHVSGRVPPSAELVSNRAYVESESHPHGGGFMPNPTLETDTDQGDAVEVHVPTADLRIDKRHLGTEGDAAAFEIEACNVGIAPAMSVTVTDEGGTGVHSLSSDDARFANGTFTLGDLDPGACETLSLTAAIDGPGHNIAYVDSPSDPIDEGANQPNDSIEEDIDGWDIVHVDGPVGAVHGTLPLTGITAGGVIVVGTLLTLLGAAALLLRRRS